MQLLDSCDYIQRRCLVGSVFGIAKRGDLIVCDDGVSSPILVGLRLSRAKTLYFKHNDMKDLDVCFKRSQGYAKSGRKLDSQRRFIVVEGLYRDYQSVR